MAKIIVPLILLAFLAIIIVAAVSGSGSCPANTYCPSPGGGSGPVDTNPQHYYQQPPEQDDFHPDVVG
jgi:hypothetical protein